jgi:crotonobetainyl-CoA:carnitine CoA-transferase CaiB-like acyl-CoA transferase
MTTTSPPDRRGDLPGGVLELAARYAAEATTGRNDLAPLSAGDLADLLWAPPTLEPDWPHPATPIPLGRGWVHAEVTAEDQGTLDTLLDRWWDLPPDEFAGRCQELRLPVSPYRRPTQPAADPDVNRRPEELRPARSDRSARPRDRLRVVDLSTHWAGPLATKLLADRGAAVIKVDPACRRDGFGDRPKLYRHLNGCKEIVDLDLRRSVDRERFEALLDDADLLVESFSRRVMGNLGYGRRQLATRFPGLAVLSIKAFPMSSPEADWLAFGPGVHAASGLAFAEPDANQAPLPAAIAYPDMLAGVAGFATALRLVEQSGPAPTAEVTLAGAIAPLGGDAR